MRIYNISLLILLSVIVFPTNMNKKNTTQNNNSIRNHTL